MAGSEETTGSRISIINSYRQEKVAWFQDRVDKDPYLAAQTMLDPLGTLSKFGLIDPFDNDLYTQITKGSLADVTHLREAVSARGLENVVSVPAAKPKELKVTAQITVCGTFTIRGLTVTVCVTFTAVFDV